MRRSIESGANLAIDHPGQPGWSAYTSHTLNGDSVAAIERRFRNANTDPAQVIAAVAQALMRSSMSRDARERENVQSLSPPVTGRRNVYRELAGDSNRSGEYIAWFAYAALASVRHRRTSQYPYAGTRSKLALDLGGKRQAGIADTSKLDAAIADIPSQLERVKVDSVFEPLRDATSRSLFMPMRDSETGQFDHGIYRRRTPYGNAFIGRGALVQIFKEQHLVMLPQELSSEEWEGVRFVCSQPTYRPTAEDWPSYVADTVFADITKSRGWDDDPRMIPVSTHYLMMAQTGMLTTQVPSQVHIATAA